MFYLPVSNKKAHVKSGLSEFLKRSLLSVLVRGPCYGRVAIGMTVCYIPSTHFVCCIGLMHHSTTVNEVNMT
jgi:hypothetical protein